jgi:phosphatidylinositol-3-phosphatase
MTFRTLKNTGLFARTVLCAASLGAVGAATAEGHTDVVRAAVPERSIEHILVIDLENESFGATFGPTSPAVYLNATLLRQGQLIPNYFGTSHVSLGNYIAQVSGQGTTPSINNDCLNLNSLTHPPVVGGFTDVLPGTDTTDQVSFPGQVIGDGCVFPAPTRMSRGARTIGDQLDRAHPDDDDEDGPRRAGLRWRMYAEDMGEDPDRDYGSQDALGGTRCAHPPIGGIDNSNSASATDQYATRHNPFVYFHSVIDDVARCNEHVVPLGKVVVDTNGAPDAFHGHLYHDLRRVETTPQFMFVTPNLCNDGHDATCAGPNVEGTKDSAGRNIGGLVGADLWLKHWMPMIFASPAYRSGRMLVVLTFDESGFTDARACPDANQVDCRSPTGPNVTNPGFSPVLALFRLQTPPTATFQYAGGGQVGAVLFNPRFIEPGSINTTGSYNHYSALRSFEDILGITRGGDDGLGHLGYAAVSGLKPFGPDVFNRVAGPHKRD